MLSERYGLPVINSPETGGILPGEWYVCVWEREGGVAGRGGGKLPRIKCRGVVCVCMLMNYGEWCVYE